jgi:hypothetical protein
LEPIAHVEALDALAVAELAQARIRDDLAHAR